METSIASSAGDKAQSAELQTALATREAELAGFQTRCDDLSAQLSSTKAAERQAKDDAQRAIERETTSRVTQQRLASEAAAKDDAAAKLETALVTSRAVADTARAETERMRERAEMAQAKVEELAAELKTTRETQAALQARLSGTESAHANALDAAISKQTQEIAVLSERASNVQRALDEHAAELATARAGADAARDEAEAAQGAYGDEQEL